MNFLMHVFPDMEEDCQKSFGVKLADDDVDHAVTSGSLDMTRYEALAQKMFDGRC